MNNAILLPIINMKSLILLLGTLWVGGCWELYTLRREVEMDLAIPSPIPREVLRGEWTLELYSLQGEYEQKIYLWEKGPPDSIRFLWPKEVEVLALLSPPPLKKGFSFYPWGAYVPGEGRRGTLALPQGAPAWVICSLVKRRVDLRDFNIPRFFYQMTKALKDPWEGDLQLLLRYLGQREMRNWYIRRHTMEALSLGTYGEKLSPGLWYGPSLLQKPLIGGAASQDRRELKVGNQFLYNPRSKELWEVEVRKGAPPLWRRHF